MPDDMTEREWEVFHQLHAQNQLLEQDISEVIKHEFIFDEFGTADDRRTWFMHATIRNTAALFRQELLDFTCCWFPWATSVELTLTLSEEVPYQYVFIYLSPLP